MQRMLYVVIFVAGTYVLDHAAFKGRYYSQLAAASNNFEAQFNYKINDMLRPLGR